MMREECNKIIPEAHANTHTDTQTHTHTQTLDNHKCVTNSLVTAINDRTIVFEDQPMFAYLEYAWPSSLAIAHDQQSS